VDWLRRPWRASPEEADTSPPEEDSPGLTERAAPGIEALFDGLKEDGTHAILDLGAGGKGSFRFYSRFARQIRFAGLLRSPPRGRRLIPALEAIPPPPVGRYDIVLAWNLLDRLTPAEHPILVHRLAQLSSAGTRLYVVVDISARNRIHPIHYSLLDQRRVSQRIDGPLEGANQPLLPASIEALLHPFRVEHAFTLRNDLREYVSVMG
jgi:hypothetical protein